MDIGPRLRTPAPRAPPGFPQSSVRAFRDPAGVRLEHGEDLLVLRDRLALQQAALDRVPQTVRVAHIFVAHL